MLFVNVSLASAYNLNEDVANDIYFFINDSNNNEQNVPLTLEDALLQLERLKSLLKSMGDKPFVVGLIAAVTVGFISLIYIETLLKFFI